MMSETSDLFPGWRSRVPPRHADGRGDRHSPPCHAAPCHTGCPPASVPLALTGVRCYLAAVRVSTLLMANDPETFSRGYFSSSFSSVTCLAKCFVYFFLIGLLIVLLLRCFLSGY